MAVPFVSQPLIKNTRNTRNILKTTFLLPSSDVNGSRGGGEEDNTNTSMVLSTTSNNTITKSIPSNKSDSFLTVGVQFVGVSSAESTAAAATAPPAATPTRTAEKKTTIPFLVSQDESVILLLRGEEQLCATQASSHRQPLPARWNGNAAVPETLATVCDMLVLVVVIDPQQQKTVVEQLDPSFVRAIRRGLQHRLGGAESDNGVAHAGENIGMACSVLILLTTNSDNSFVPPDLYQSQKDALMDRLLPFQTPGVTANVYMLSLDDPNEATKGLETAWEEILMKTSLQQTTSELVNVPEMAQLLQGVYSQAQEQYHYQQRQQEEQEEQEDNQQRKEPANIVTENDNLKEISAATTATLATANRGDSFENEEAVLAILQSAQSDIRRLETHLEQLWLGFSFQDSNEENGRESISPLSQAQDFGSKANQILETYRAAVVQQQQKQEEENDERAWSEAAITQSNRNLWQHILPPLKQLYDQQLEYFREHYGKAYEDALETSTINIASKKKQQMSPQHYQDAWKEAAADITTDFRKAAQAAVPSLCREGRPLRDADFDYVPSLEGLLSDMMLATEQQEELLGLDDEEEDDEGYDDSTGMEGGRRKGPAKWYEKVAAKAFVFAVNYFQGWLAYQGIKRAAARRDAHLPKFPLF